jgi:lipopolysaccharide transport system ATP-binding protein
LTVYFSEKAGGKRFQMLENICPFEVTMYGLVRDFEWRPHACTYLEDSDWVIVKK